MKKLIVISDSHGNMQAVDGMLPLVAENDYLIHLGDGLSDIRALRDAYPDKAYFCAGNCDYVAYYPTDGVLEVDWRRKAAVAKLPFTDTPTKRKSHKWKGLRLSTRVRCGMRLARAVAIAISLSTKAKLPPSSSVIPCNNFIENESAPRYSGALFLYTK